MSFVMNDRIDQTDILVNEDIDCTPAGRLGKFKL